MSKAVKIIYGVPFSGAISGPFLEVLEKYNIKELDSGSSYFDSEQGIGDASLPEKGYLIHTKTTGYEPGAQSYQGILDSATKSLKRLGVEQVETYLLHTPDPENSITDALDAIQKLYTEGRFKHFGISNFLPSQVQEIYNYCSSKNYVLPTVYEGHYNAVGRHAETELLPLLRKLKISFNAYSALAAGFLAKSPEFFANNPTDLRWNKDTSLGQLYQSLYNRPKLIAALKTWNEIAEEAGLTKPALGFRWVAHNSALKGELGDGVIVGAMRPDQLEQTLGWLRDGPLEEGIVKRIEGIWKDVKDEAAFDNFNG